MEIAARSIGVTAEVTESDIDAMIERLRKQQMKYSAVSRAAASGDKVTIDFEGDDRRRGICRRQGREHRASSWARAGCCRELEQGLIGAAVEREARHHA